MKKLVIFDMDGLLIDSEMYCYQGYRDLIKEEFNKDMTLEEYGRFFAGKSPASGIAMANEYYGIELTNEIILGSFRKRKDVKVIHPIKPGAKELVAYCKKKGIKMVIASSSGKQRIEEQVSAGGILEYFDDVVSGMEVARGKPFPDVFLIACNKVGIDPLDAVVLEDSEAGLRAAISGNIDAIWIPDIARPAKEIVSQCAAVLPSLDKVIDYLEKN